MTGAPPVTPSIQRLTPPTRNPPILPDVLHALPSRTSQRRKPHLASQRDEDAQYYRQVLHELIEIGTDLARAVHRQATPAPSAAKPAPAAAPAARPHHRLRPHRPHPAPHHRAGPQALRPRPTTPSRASGRARRRAVRAAPPRRPQADHPRGRGHHPAPHRRRRGGGAARRASRAPGRPRPRRRPRPAAHRRDHRLDLPRPRHRSTSPAPIPGSAARPRTCATSAPAQQGPARHSPEPLSPEWHSPEPGTRAPSRTPTSTGPPGS